MALQPHSTRSPQVSPVRTPGIVGTLPRFARAGEGWSQAGRAPPEPLTCGESGGQALGGP